MAQPAWQDPVPLGIDTAPVPEYGSGSLADLLPTLVAGQGVAGFTPAIAELTPADRNCVFLIDGLGWEQIRSHPDEAPFLHSLLPTSRGGTGRPITAGFPATTATSLASVGTGLPPGEHGLTGYTVRNPATGALMNQLRWRPGRSRKSGSRTPPSSPSPTRPECAPPRSPHPPSNRPRSPRWRSAAARSSAG